MTWSGKKTHPKDGFMLIYSWFVLVYNGLVCPGLQWFIDVYIVAILIKMNIGRLETIC